MFQKPYIVNYMCQIKNSGFCKMMETQHQGTHLWYFNMVVFNMVYSIYINGYYYCLFISQKAITKFCTSATSYTTLNHLEFEAILKCSIKTFIS